MTERWQPIDTAPRDGTKILVWHPQVQGIALDRQAGAAVDEWKHGKWWRSYPAQQPTHWMPLPGPPLTLHR